MRLNIFLAAASIAALTAGAAAAQSATSDNQMPPAAPSADQAAMPASATTSPITGPVTSSPTSADQAYTLKAGDPTVISNSPVPDTPQNRAAYGRPLSNAGRHTAATGD